jgi:hypothetical protein
MALVGGGGKLEIEDHGGEITAGRKKGLGCRCEHRQKTRCRPNWSQQTREKGTWVDGGTAPLLDGTRHWGTTFGAEGGVADLNTTPALGAE